MQSNTTESISRGHTCVCAVVGGCRSRNVSGMPVKLFQHLDFLQGNAHVRVKMHAQRIWDATSNTLPASAFVSRNYVRGRALWQVRTAQLLNCVLPAQPGPRNYPAVLCGSTRRIQVLPRRRRRQRLP
ncbi:unnamed protein product [Effrenium voratum]|uniref:Uncharacterized protein n=1 Tax=Effrenium voratum TaxID=2562239 RepID=A0AA36NBN0_9DINO|nr:unnamed protein product [Effrenium voratum]